MKELFIGKYFLGKHAKDQKNLRKISDTELALLLHDFDGSVAQGPKYILYRNFPNRHDNDLAAVVLKLQDASMAHHHTNARVPSIRIEPEYDMATIIFRNDEIEDKSYVKDGLLIFEFQGEIIQIQILNLSEFLSNTSSLNDYLNMMNHAKSA